MIKCLVSDLDGTLLKRDETIAERDIAAISKWIETGHRFWVASGRPIYMFEHLHELGLFPEYMLCSTGAVITNGQETDIMGKIGPDIGRRLIDLLDAYSDIDYVLDTIGSDSTYANTSCGYFYERMGREPEDTLDPKTFFDTDATMFKAFVVCRDDEVLYALKNEINEDFPGELMAYTAGGGCLEVVSSKTGKWSSIAHLADKVGLSASEIACIGDEGNDIEMIASSGIGFAVSSAIAEVLISADHIVKDVAEAIEILLASSDL